MLVFIHMSQVLYYYAQKFLYVPTGLVIHDLSLLKEFHTKETVNGMFIV